MIFFVLYDTLESLDSVFQKSVWEKRNVIGAQDFHILLLHLHSVK